jgi:hypothetical protein
MVFLILPERLVPGGALTIGFLAQASNFTRLP